jgi:hypothetical protein
MEPVSPALLIRAFEKYSVARTAFLNELGCPGSNRDPLAEFSERLVAALVNGHLTESRVQPDYDVIGPSGEKIQVKYLANPGNKWINEHEIKFSLNMDSYALVFFENLQLVAILMFSRAGIESVCRSLNKRHRNQHDSLQLTQRNFQQILDNAEGFQPHGVHILYRQRATSL